MRYRTKSAVLAVWVVVCCACGPKDTPSASETSQLAPSSPAQTATPPSTKKVAPKKEDSKSTVTLRAEADWPGLTEAFQENAKETAALVPKPTAQQAAGKVWEAQPCTVEGAPPFLQTSTVRMFRAVEWTSDRLYVVGHDDRLMAFRVAKSDRCVLRFDENFMVTNAKRNRQAVRALSSGKAGRVLAASHGVLRMKLFEDQAFSRDCRARGVLALHESGTWGLTSWVRSDVQKVILDKDECSYETWALSGMRDPKTRRGPFETIYTLSILGDQVWVGGVLAESGVPAAPDAKRRAVVAFSLEGKELHRVQSSADPDAHDSFGWVHSIDACPQGVCILDAARRRMTMWSKQGAFLGSLDLRALLGLETPWMADVSFDQEGRGYIVAAQDRAKSNVAQGLIYRVTQRSMKKSP